MNTYIRQLGIAMLPVLILFFPWQAQATSSEVVLNLEGNPTCDSLGYNQAVIGYRADPDESVPITLITAEDNEQQLTFSVGIYDNPGHPDNGNAFINWSLTTINGEPIYDINGDLNPDADLINAINYVILKGQGGKIGARVFHLGSTDKNKGAIEDNLEIAPSSNLSAISFCYGLTAGINDEPEEPPIEFTSLPNCDAFDLNYNNDASDYDCANSQGNQELIINMALEEDNFGFSEETIRACTCNVSMPQCNADLPVQPVNEDGQYLGFNGSTYDVLTLIDEDGVAQPITAELEILPTEDRACLEVKIDPNSGYLIGSFDPATNSADNNINQNTPFRIEGVEDPDSYVCYTIGGTRYCYGHY